MEDIKAEPVHLQRMAVAMRVTAHHRCRYLCQHGMWPFNSLPDWVVVGQPA